MQRPHLSTLWTAAIVAALALTFFAGSAMADPRQWQRTGDRDGIPVRQGHHIEWYRTGYRNDAGTNPHGVVRHAAG